ncbi:MAG: CarD family transcriptional regulator [Acidobacteria bacterium]|nr:CarD family transcriptional regulator [Acidobacteriota bacterium]MBK8148403.1 CarD family transcriptional regulator [Acidobacteriota bacterium]
MTAKAEKFGEELAVGQMVAYPNQGVCLVDHIEKKVIGTITVSFYALRVLSDNSTIFVPMDNANAVGIRPIITSSQYDFLIETLGADFEIISSDWKLRAREFGQKLQSGDVFAAADVLKKLTFLSHEKKLSFREQTYLDKARFLIVSEITSAGYAPETLFEVKLDELIDLACRRHLVSQPFVSAKLSH